MENQLRYIVYGYRKGSATKAILDVLEPKAQFRGKAFNNIFRVAKRNDETVTSIVVFHVVTPGHERHVRTLDYWPDAATNMRAWHVCALGYAAHHRRERDRQGFFGWRAHAIDTRAMYDVVEVLP